MSPFIKKVRRIGEKVAKPNFNHFFSVTKKKKITSSLLSSSTREGKQPFVKTKRRSFKYRKGWSAQISERKKNMFSYGQSF